MITMLVVTLCAASEPTLCETHRVPIATASAMCFAPADLTRVARPGWRVARWRCETDTKSAQG